MTEVEKLVREYIPSVNIMQLATSAHDQPWTCNLHFCSDENLNIYWLSTPDRRHSEEIKQNSKVSATFLVHENTTDENYIIGVSTQGTAELLDKEDYKKIAQSFGKKHGTPQKFLDSVISGTNPHVFYKLTPSEFVIFDTKNFADDPRQEWKIGA